jgi:hypothetical protein
MKRVWLGLPAGVVAVGLALWSPERCLQRQENRVAEPVVATIPATALQRTGSVESEAGALRTQFHSLWRSEPWARGKIDELLSAWRALLARSDPAAAVRSLSVEELVTPFGTAALEAWLALDSAAASAWIAVQPGATDHQAWLVAETLTRQPQVFAAFCRGLDQDSWAERFLDHSSRVLVRESPAAAALLAESLSPGERQTRVFETIASDWMLRDPDAAQAWIHGVADPALRHRLIAVGAQSYASTDPLSALEWLLAQSSIDAALQEPVQTIAGIWRHTASPEMIDSLDYLVGRSERATDRRAHSD